MEAEAVQQQQETCRIQENQQTRENPQTQESTQTQVLKVLEALKEASRMIQNRPAEGADPPSSPSIKALLELQPESDILSNDPSLSSLSHHLSHLQSLFQDLPHQEHHHHLSIPTVLSFFHRRSSSHEISRVAGSVEAEIQAWIDRQTIQSLVNSLRPETCQSDEEKIRLISAFETRISQGFNRDLQDLVLKSKVFDALEWDLSYPAESKRVKERIAQSIAALVQFNKDVFVGQVLMGHTVRVLVYMSTPSSLWVLCNLIRSIKSPLVDDLESNGDIPRIISLVGAGENVEIRLAALDCVLEIGYFGRKEAIEAMLEVGLVQKLIELQRSDDGGSLLEMGSQTDDGDCGVSVETTEKKSTERRWLEKHPFSSCVARFAIQMEVGEGLRQREKRAFKQEMLKLVREATASEAEAATILAEILWGSSP